MEEFENKQRTMSRAEKFIQDYTSNCYNYNSYAQDPIPWLTPDQALRAVEIAREEMLNEICEWIDVNYVHYLDISAKGTLTANIRQFIGDLKQAMEDECI